MTFENSPDSGARILIAENGAPGFHGLTRSFEARGFRVTSAANGAAALDEARRHKPALVICDLTSAEMDGSELCAQIKGDRILAGVPVILAIHLTDVRDAVRALECGADDFVIKPCDPAHVLRRVQALLAGDDAGRDEQRAITLEVEYGGQKHPVSAGRPRLLQLLLSTCEAAIERSRELGTTRELLLEANQKLRSLGLVPEDRVKPRPRELESGSGVSKPAAALGGAPAAASGRHVQPLFGQRSLRVLLIDDDPSLIESLRSALQDEGHKVTAAGGGQAGIDAFRDAQKGGRLFDIVITDLRMPYVDGRQVVTSIRGMSPATPIILLTGWGQHAGGESETPPQVDRLLGKPPRIRELRAALSELTGRRATDRFG